MKVLHINAGLEDGGGKNHILSLLSQFNPATAELLVLEKGIVAEEAEKLGITVHALEQKSRYDVSVLKRLTQLIQERAFDIVHTHGARANFLFSAIRQKVSAQWVITVHSDPQLDFMSRGLKGAIFTKLNLAALKKADHLIAVTDSLVKPLLDLGVAQENITVVYNGISFAEENHRSLPNNTVFTMTYVARLHPIKGHDMLLESLKTATFTDFKLNLVGDGDLRTHLEQKVRELHLAEKVQFLGFLDAPQVADTIAQSDLTVLASSNEGFPLVLLESAKQKVPFVATDVGDVALLVPDKQYGWCVPPQSVSAFAKALEEAFAAWNDGTLKTKGENVYQLASATFSLEQFYKGTLAVYNQLLR